MRKQLLVASLCCLVGCAGNEGTVTTDANSKEVIQQEAEKIEEQSILAKAEQKRNKQLGNVLEQVAQRFGVMRNNSSYYDGGFGLVHADFIDLDQDGQNEMYILFKSSSYFDESLTHRNQDGYIFEIWSADGESDEATLLYNEVINLDSSNASDLSMSFVQSASGEIFVKKNHFQIAQGTNMDESTYYVYRDGSFSRALEVYHSYGDMDVQMIDGKEVDLKTFEEQMKHYEGEETFIVKSSAGDKELAFDTADISGHIGNIFTTLTKDFNTILTDGEDASSEAFEQIQVGMKESTFYRTMDKRDPETYELLINGLILKGKVEQDGGYLDYFMGITEEQIAEKMKQLYDIELDSAALELPSPKEPSQTEFLHYEDGIFYIPPSDHYSDYVIRDVTAAKKVTDDIYLVTFRDTLFDAMNYMNTMDDYEFDPKTYENTPISEWPEETKAFITTGIPSYAVVKLADDVTKLYYMGYRNLTEEELKGF